MFTVRKKGKALLGSKFLVEDVLKTPIFFEICKFLPIKDILNFQMLNKTIFFGVKLESNFVQTLSESLKNKYTKTINLLETKLSFLFLGLWKKKICFRFYE